MTTTPSAKKIRSEIRLGLRTGNTSGLCGGNLQCNLIILPKNWSMDFLNFCKLNPKPCPLISMTDPGDFTSPLLGDDIDLRSDIPSYRIFRDGVMTEEVSDLSEFWKDGLVSFLLGCSFSFEEALIDAGLEVRNVTESVNVPMYISNIECNASGPFSGKLVVSMRPFTPKQAQLASEICGRYPSAHGDPVHFGNPEVIGIKNLDDPDFGDKVHIRDGEQPLFWACGVTSQVVIQNAKPPLSITHSPGCMLITDLQNGSLMAI